MIVIFIAWIAFISLEKKTSWNPIKECVRGFYNVIMRSEDIKILEFDQYQKSHKALFIIYADIECITEETDGCKKNP